MFNPKPILLMSTDGGASLSSIDNGLPDVPTNTLVLDPLAPDYMYIGNDLGVYSSIDNGNSWQAFSNNLPDAIMVMDLSVSPSNRKLRLASHGNGVYEADMIEPNFTAIDEPKRIDLNRIYPNPAVDVITIDLTVTQVAQVTLQVYNLKGEMMSSKIQQAKSGQNQLSIDTSQLANGTYYVVAEIGSARTAEKIVVIK